MISNGVVFFNIPFEVVFYPAEFADIHLHYGDITPFIAPYWIDNDPSLGGSVSYEVHTGSSHLLSQVNDYISHSQSVEFIGTWMLVVDWFHVPLWSFNDTVRNMLYYMLIGGGVYIKFLWQTMKQQCQNTIIIAIIKVYLPHK